MKVAAANFDTAKQRKYSKNTHNIQTHIHKHNAIILWYVCLYTTNQYPFEMRIVVVVTFLQKTFVQSSVFHLFKRCFVDGVLTLLKAIPFKHFRTYFRNCCGNMRKAKILLMPLPWYKSFQAKYVFAGNVSCIS